MRVLDALLLRDEKWRVLLERSGKKRLLEAPTAGARRIRGRAARTLSSSLRAKEEDRQSSPGARDSGGPKAAQLELASVELDRDRAIRRGGCALPGLRQLLFDADSRELILLSRATVCCDAPSTCADSARKKRSSFTTQRRAGAGRYPPYWINIPRFC